MPLSRLEDYTMNQWLLKVLAGVLISVQWTVAGEVSGVVLGHKGEPVPNETLVLCDQYTGIPVNGSTFNPFSETMPDTKHLAVTVTDAKGYFLMNKVPDGTYRLIGQDQGRRWVFNGK
jgi:hypothetical protein